MTNENQLLWCEKYRPQKIAECILPDEIKSVFQTYVDKEEIPNLILTGTAGVGKTTVAIAMCREAGLDYIIINGSDESGIDTLRVKVKGFASSMSLMSNRKAIIIDEADYLTPAAQAAFRGVIEEFAGNCSFIFTCNFLNRLIEPLHSRCAVIDFKLSGKQKQEMAKQFLQRVSDILETEGIDHSSKVLVELIMKFFPDYRRIINELQKYSVGGKIDIGILAQISDVTLTELIDHIKAKSFKDIRRWVGINANSDPQKILRDIYDKLSDILKPESVPAAILLLAKYQFQSAFVADAEINTMAMVTEIMLECETR